MQNKFSREFVEQKEREEKESNIPPRIVLPDVTENQLKKDYIDSWLWAIIGGSFLVLTIFALVARAFH